MKYSILLGKIPYLSENAIIAKNKKEEINLEIDNSYIWK